MIDYIDFQKNFPFLTCIKSSNKEYVGIIINANNSLVSIYDLSILKTTEEKQEFLKLGEIWWWESNRKIPINIFLKNEMKQFKSIVKTFNGKDVVFIFGPKVNLEEIAEKRLKRKSIQLVKRIS
jgi:hypothetical protein